jgi:hypothetical protein
LFLQKSVHLFFNGVGVTSFNEAASQVHAGHMFIVTVWAGIAAKNFEFFVKKIIPVASIRNAIINY